MIGLHAVIVAYLCFNLLVAPVNDNAGGAIATIALAGVACHVCAATLPTVAPTDLRALGRGLALGCTIVAAFLLFEYATHMACSEVCNALQQRQTRAGSGSIFGKTPRSRTCRAILRS